MVQNHYVAYFKLFGPYAQLHGGVSQQSGNMHFLCLFRPFFSTKKSENCLLPLKKRLTRYLYVRDNFQQFLPVIMTLQGFRLYTLHHFSIISIIKNHILYFNVSLKKQVFKLLEGKKRLSLP